MSWELVRDARLTHNQAVALRNDLDDMAREAESLDDAGDAVVEALLLRRIGGREALVRYAEVLVVGRRKDAARHNHRCECGYPAWHEGPCGQVF